jgi:outer membrane protein assembly factor BamB
VFRFWDGDDSDATTVIDTQGMLYTGVEGDRMTKRMESVGNLLKIDPTKPDNPVVWSIKTPGHDNGTWSTPAFWKNTVVWPTKPGDIYGIDKTTGKVLWQLKTAGPQLSSPNIIDGVLVQADGKGVVRAWDLGDGTAMPKLLWTVDIGTNIETTPAIWNGRIYFGSRDGYEYCLGL